MTRRMTAGLGLCCLCALGARGGTWRAVDGDWNGSFSDAAHWAGGLAGAGEANVVSAQSADVAVRVEEATETTARLVLEGNADRSAVLDAREASLLFAAQAEEAARWPESAFDARMDGRSFFAVNSGDARWSRQAQARLADVSVKMGASAPGVAEMRVKGGAAGGVFDFVHPDPQVGDIQAPNGARPTVSLFAGGASAAFSHGRLAFEGVAAQLPSVFLGAAPAVAEVAVSGGSLDIAGNLTASAASNVVSLADGARLRAEMNVTLSAGEEGALVVKMADGCETTLRRLTVPEGRRVAVVGGSLVTPALEGDARARLDLDGVAVAVGGWTFPDGRVTLANGTFSPDSGFVVNGAGGAYLMTNMTGATSLSASGGFSIAGSNVVTFTADRLDRTLVVNGGADHGRIGAGPYGELNLEGGTFEFRAPSGSRRLCLGHGSESVGVLNVRGGRLVSKVAQDGATRSFGLGITYGTGFITVSGGEVDVSGLCICTEENAAAPESVFRQTGGLVKVAAGDWQASCQSVGLCATGNGKTTRRARIVLDGGVTEANVIAGGTSGRCRGGTGWTAFEANGGTVRVNGPGAHVLRDFDEATLGARGLTVDDAGFGCTIAQSLAGAAGARGRLVLTGAGVKTVTGTNAVELAVAGGTVVFAAGADNAGVDLVVTNGAAVSFSPGGTANRTLASLVLGDAGALVEIALAAGEPLTVRGDVSVGNVSLALSGAFETGASYDLLVCGGALSEASAAAWGRALARGLGEEQGGAFSVVQDGQGRSVLRMAVRERRNLTIDVPACAESNLVEDVVFLPSDTLTVNVGARGTLQARGKVGRGALVKTGEGRAVFDHAETAFAGGVAVRAGRLDLPRASTLADPALSGAAVTIGAGTLALGRAGAAPSACATPLVVQTEEEGEAAVLACASDVAFAAPTVARGCFVKRGAGALTLSAAGVCAFSSHAGKDVKNKAPAAEPIAFDAFGAPPADNYASLTVAEGDLALTGAGSYTIAGLGAVYVGMPAEGIEKPARLLVDGTRAAFKGAHFHVGSGVRAANCPQPQPAFVVTNGGSAVVTSLHVGWNADAAARPRVRVSGVGSVLRATEYLYLAEGGGASASEADPPLLVSAGAALRLPRMDDGNANHALALRNGALGVVDGGELTDENGREARVTAAGTGGALVFKNGATCCVSELRPDADTASIDLTFDDALWSFGDRRTLALTRPERITVTARGKGLVLAPAAGTNLTFNLPVTGSGGLVKRGAGAVTFTVAPAVAGVCRVEEGAFALADGVEAQGLTFAGGGALAGGTFRDAALLAPLGDAGAVTGAVPVLAGAALTGATRVDLGRTEASPVQAPWPQNVVVAAYAGAAPDVSGWKVRNAGGPHLAATFTAVGGQVLMSLKTTGFMLILR